ncbi:Protoheme IX farnesyltransferase, mitochondrial [Halotydeus destructor]|nr:Protoheme IX farnesyltransferase, mitochondrial [Halotydeus destructor]
MKRSNVVNTWVGSIVGAIPPVMGYTAATGVVDLSALILGGVLYSWQFPHFKALSWNLRNDYARAGYRMTSVTDPRVCLNTAFRHSILVSAYCVAACSPAVGLTSWWFAMDSSPFNVYLIYLSYKFKKEPTAANSRKLFRFSLVHLPAIILLMLIAKESKTSRVDHVAE